MTHRLFTTLATVALAVAVLTAPATAAAPKVFGEIPLDAPGAIVIRDLAGLSKKVAMLDKKLGLDRPEMADMLGMMKAMSGMVAGMDDDGDIAMVMTAMPDPDAGAGEPDMVILVPLKNYADFLGNFGVEDVDAAGITPFEMQGQPSFAKKHGGYAAIAQTRAVLKAFKGGGDAELMSAKVGKLGNQAMSGSDVMLYVNFAKVGPEIAPMIQQGLAQAMVEMQANLPPGDDGEMAELMMKMYGDLINGFVRDADGMVVGLDLTEAGVGFAMSAQFKPGSPMAKQFAANGKGVAMNKLPKRPFMLAMSMDTDALPIGKWIAAMAGHMPEGHWMAGMLENSAKSFGDGGGVMQQAYYGPVAGGGVPSLLNSVSIVSTDNPAAYIKSTREALELMGKQEVAPGMKAIVSWKDNAMQVAGRPVHQYTLRYQLPPEMMKQLGPMALFVAQGSTGYVTHTDKAVIQTSGADPTLIKAALDAAEGKGELLEANPQFAAARKHMHDHRVMEAYIGIGTIMQMVNGLLGMFAPDAVVPVPADLPPVATSISVHSGSASMRQHVPMEVIVAAKNAITKVMEMQGITPGGGGEPDVPLAPDSPNVVTFTGANFDADALRSDKPVLISFWASWDDKSKKQAAVINDLADAYKGKAVVGKVDVDRQQKLADRYKIEAIPTLLILKKGEVVAKLVGYREADSLRKELDKHVK